MVFSARPKIQSNANFWACVVLMLAVICVYGQAGSFDFISYDDGIYVYDNPHVKSGLNRDSMIWAFRFEAKDNTYWHPLTWLSLMLDVTLFGLNPAGHHQVNVLFHLLNTLLLFFIFRWMTDAPWPSFFLAALFGVHPINVESVVWVAERKNVLSTFFWMLTTLGYIYYTKRPRAMRYLLVAIMLTAGLLAKKAGKPVSVQRARRIQTPSRRNHYGPKMTMKIGCKNDGTLTAMETTWWAWGGRNGSRGNYWENQDSTFDTRHIKYTAFGVATNTGVSSGYR